ncbi:MAG TPA: hypothetical protein VMM36_12060 [Opitutaceae bacterium]|nr:hypothetical protein [Opitutaceae bacterium]
MESLIGVGLALAVSVFARIVGLDRDRAFYPTVMIVIAMLYGLFAAIGGLPAGLTLEWIAMGVFILVATLGFKFNLWLVAAALFAHGVFDFFHPHLISNPGVPVWWPGFCMAYDVTAAAFLAWLLWSGIGSAPRPINPR